MRFDRWLTPLLLGGALSLVLTQTAHADPVTIATIIVGFTSLTGVAASIATFVIAFGVSIVESALINKLFAPSQAASNAARQAAILQLTLGEAPRQVGFGRLATGGSVADAFDYGGENGTDWEALVVSLLDHPCDALEGVWVGDSYVDLTGHTDGPVAGYEGLFEIYFRDASAADPDFPASFAALLDTNGDPLSPAVQPGSLKGVTKVIAAYKADDPDDDTPVWTGRPTFLWVLRGKRCYDPRLDSTVPGGSGPQRWSDPTTWTWTENAEVCRYNFDRGIYALDQVDEPGMLWVGRGLSAIEAPPQAIFAAANLCDEPVATDDSGGTEDRYRVGGVINADDTFDAVAEYFASATAGFVIQPEGGVRVEPGQAKAVVAALTAGDLVVGARVRRADFKPANDRVNIIVPTYPEPTQKWVMTGGDIVRSDADIIGDKGQKPLPLSFPLVPFKGQVRRICEIQYRQVRLERTRTITAVPALADGNCASGLEAGDWVTFPINHRDPESQLGVWRIMSVSIDASEQVTLQLAETSAAVYGFGDLSSPVVSSPSLPAPDALFLTGVTASGREIEGDGGAIMPAIRMAWDTPVVSGIVRIRVEVRKFGESAAAPTMVDAVNAGEVLVTNGVGSATNMEARLVPLGGPGRSIVPSAWLPVTTPGLVSHAAATVGGMTPEELLNALLAATAGAGEAWRRLTRAQAAYAIQQQQADERLKQAFGYTRDGLPIGGFSQHIGVVSDSLVFDRSLMGLRNSAGTAFILNDNTVQFSDGQLVVDRFGMIYSQIGNAVAAVSDEEEARTAADAAAASTVTALSATVSGNYGTLNAAIINASNVAASATGTVASNLASVSTTVNGLTSSVTTLSSSVNGLSSQWVLSVVSSGSGRVDVAGARFAAGGGTSSIAFYASEIGFTNGSDTRYPLSISGGILRATNLEVDTIRAGSIYTDTLTVGAASGIVAAAVYAGFGVSGSPGTCVDSYHTTSDGKVIVLFNISVPNSGSDSGVICKLYCDGFYIDECSAGIKGSFTDQCSGVFYVVPGPGSHHFWVTVESTPGSGGGMTSGAAKLVTIDMKKAG